MKSGQAHAHLPNMAVTMESGFKILFDSIVNLKWRRKDSSKIGTHTRIITKTSAGSRPTGKSGDQGARVELIATDTHLVAGRVVERVDRANDAFSSLVRVRAMGTGVEQHLIGFDAEFVCTCGHDSESDHDPTKCRREILSYQFSTPLLVDSSKMAEIIVFPLIGQRIELKDALFVVTLLCGLDSLSAEAWNDRYCAVSKSGYWDGDWCLGTDGKPLKDDSLSIARQRYLYKNYGVNLTLAGHYLNADLTAFREPYAMDGYDTKWVDVRRRVISAGGGLISMKPVRVKRYSRNQHWVSQFSITVRDTMTHAPTGFHSLDVLGDACGVAKLDVSKTVKSRIDKLLWQSGRYCPGWQLLFQRHAAKVSAPCPMIRH